MDLEFGPEYDEFTKEVESFCKEYSNAIITTANDKKFEMHDALSGNSNEKSGKIVNRSDWQNSLSKKVTLQDLFLKNTVAMVANPT